MFSDILVFLYLDGKPREYSYANRFELKVGPWILFETPFQGRTFVLVDWRKMQIVKEYS